MLVGKESLKFAGSRLKETFSLDFQAGAHEGIEIVGQEINRHVERLGGPIVAQRLLRLRTGGIEEIRRARLLSRDGEDKVSVPK